MTPPAPDEVVRCVVAILATRRASLGWSQRRLAAKAGVDPKTVSLIERGVRSPTLFTLVLLANAMDLPLSAVLRDAEESIDNQRK